MGRHCGCCFRKKWVSVYFFLTILKQNLISFLSSSEPLFIEEFRIFARVSLKKSIIYINLNKSLKISKTSSKKDNFLLSFDRFTNWSFYCSLHAMKSSLYLRFSKGLLFYKVTDACKITCNPVTEYITKTGS